MPNSQNDLPQKMAALRTFGSSRWFHHQSKRGRLQVPIFLKAPHREQEVPDTPAFLRMLAAKFSRGYESALGPSPRPSDGRYRITSAVHGPAQAGPDPPIQKQTFVGLASTTLPAQPIMSALEGVPVTLMAPRAAQCDPKGSFARQGQVEWKLSLASGTADNLS